MIARLRSLVAVADFCLELRSDGIVRVSVHAFALITVNEVIDLIARLVVTLVVCVSDLSVLEYSIDALSRGGYDLRVRFALLSDADVGQVEEGEDRYDSDDGTDDEAPDESGLDFTVGHVFLLANQQLHGVIVSLQ
jgi:hypothetical protein